MIAQVNLVGFQSLERLGLDLDRLTVISGPSGSGKSAFVRALRAALGNTRGTFFIREGASETQVSLVFLDGVGSTADPLAEELTYVKRLSGKSGTVEYLIGSESHTAVGSGPVEAVLEQTRIDPDLQVVDQFAPPYLLASSPSEVARAFGALTRADVIQAAVTKAAGHGRKAGGEAATLTSLAAAAEATYEAFDWYPDFAVRVVSLGPLAERAKALSTRLQALRDLAGRVQALQAREARLAPQTAAYAKRLPVMLELAGRAGDLGPGRLRSARGIRDDLHLHSQQVRGMLAKRKDVTDLITEFETSLADAVSAVDACPLCLAPASAPGSHLHEQLVERTEPAAPGTALA